MKLKQFILFIAFAFTISMQAQDNSFVQAEEIGTPSLRAFLIDVRTPDEYKQGSIPSAVNIDVENEFFPIRVEALNKNNPIVVFCRAGDRSKRASKILKENGFTNVKELKGGYEAWLKIQEPTDAKDGKAKSEAKSKENKKTKS